MEFDLNFDDSLFDTGKEAKESDKLVSYNVKYCEPMWFDKELSCSSTDSDESKMQSLKYSADCHYLRCEYEMASNGYKQLLELIPAHNGVMKRDVNESLARCSLQLNRTAQAMESYNNVLKSACNDDHEFQALHLLREIYKQDNNIQGEIKVLQKLINDNPMNASLWLDLASGYRRVPLQTSVNEDTAHTVQENQVELCSLSCLIRARLLLHNALPVTRSFVKRQMTEKLKQVEERINEVNIEKDIKERAEKLMAHDLRYSLSSADDNEDEETKKVQCTSKHGNKSFEDTWFRWMKVHIQ